MQDYERKEGKGMYCKNCGKELPDDARFCPECGEQVADGDIEQKKEVYEKEFQFEPDHSNTQMRMMKTGLFILAGVLIIVVIACFAYISKKGREAEMRAVQEEKERAEEQAKEAEAARIQAEEEKQAAQEEAAQAQESAKETAQEKPVSTVNNNYYYYQGSHYGEHDYYDNVQVDGYLWPTDEYYLTYGDLEGMDQDTVEAVRNEIYARHGYAFEKKRWRNYFGSKSWYYRDNSCTQEVAKSRMNSVEKANLETIVDYEKHMGWR